MSEFPINSYADSLGFPVIYPTSNQEDGYNCWDCWSNRTLTHNGGGDSEGIAGMVSWALTKFNGDPKRVFAIGASSGAMMVNVLAGTYPDVFAALAGWSGVPDGCFIGSTSSTPANPDQTCANGTKAKQYSAQQWATYAKNSYPGYSGARPNLMLVHGTADNVVSYLNFGAQLAQWSTLEGLSFSKNISNDPQSGWKRVVYGDGTKLIGFEVANGGHIPPWQGDATFKFFGLLGGGNNGGGGSSTTSASVSASSLTSTSTASGGGSSGCSTARYGQCGGQGFTGCTTCALGSTCKYSNACKSFSSSDFASHSNADSTSE